jgi:hypothetical protein
VESTIIGLEMTSKMLDDRISPKLSNTIPPRRAIVRSLVVRIFRRKRNLDLIKPSGSPRYKAPITALANKPDKKTASSGYDDAAEKRPEATKRVIIMGYRMALIIDRKAG